MKNIKAASRGRVRSLIRHAFLFAVTTVSATAATVWATWPSEAAAYGEGSAQWVVTNSDSTTFVVSISVEEGDASITTNGVHPPDDDLPRTVVQNGNTLYISLSGGGTVLELSGEFGVDIPEQAGCEYLACSDNNTCVTTDHACNCDTFAPINFCYNQPCNSGGGGTLQGMADFTYDEPYNG